MTSVSTFATSDKMPSITMNGSAQPWAELISKLEASSPSNISSELTAEVGDAFSQMLAKKVSDDDTKAILATLHKTELEHHPDILATVSNNMMAAAHIPDTMLVEKMMQSHPIRAGDYHGGLCDIVGTGGDGWKTFNISTASSIIASAYLRMAKHGNRASTSNSGSADVLARLQTPEGSPQLAAVKAELVAKVYQETNYAFLFAPNFHPGLAHIGPLRKQIPHPTIFNLLGPLANPATAVIEASVIGTKNRELVPLFAEALRLKGHKKAMVVCGYENLDEISCANPTQCARLVQVAASNGTGSANGNSVHAHSVQIEHFSLSPEDYGLPSHPLTDVAPGGTPEDNAAIMHRLLTNTMQPSEEPIVDFVLMNVAALLVVSGVCDGDKSAFGDDTEVITEVGPGGGRWKEGVRLARLAIQSGKAYEELRKFIKFSNNVSS